MSELNTLEIETQVMPVAFLKKVINELQAALFTHINYFDGWSPEFRELLDELEDVDDDLYCPEEFLNEIHDSVQVYIRDIEFILNGNFIYPELDKEDINREGIPVESFALYSFMNLPGINMDPDALHLALKTASDIWVVLNLSLMRLYQLDGDIHTFANREHPEYFVELEDLF